MKIRLRTRIVGVALLAAILPLIATISTIYLQQNKVDHLVNQELVEISEQTITRVVLDAYGMCKVAGIEAAADSGAGGLDPAKLEQLRKLLMDIRIGEDGYVFVLGGKGDDRGQYILSLEGKSDGANIWDATDDNGEKFVQNIVNSAVALQPGEVAIEKYSWKNKGETKARKKLAPVTYFEPLDWVIGASAYEDEFLNAQEHVAHTLSNVILQTGIIGIGILLVSFFVALLVGTQISRPMNLITRGAQLLAQGDLNLTGMDRSQTAKIDKRGDELGEVGRAFSELIENQSAKAEAAHQIASGNLDVEVAVASEEDTLGEAMVTMRNSIRDVITAMNDIYSQQKAGDIDAFVDLESFQGAYRELAEGYNGGLKLHIDAILMILDILGQYAEGAFEKEMPVLPGKQIIATQRINKLRENLSDLINEMKTLVQNALDGDLSSRANADKFNGGYREIVDGVNQTLDAVVQPIQESSIVLQKMAKGDLSHHVQGDYKGDHAAIKEALNGTLDSLNELLSQVAVAVEQVSSGSTQVSSASQSLSQGATEQASSLEEINSSMTEVGGQTRMNAENATQANQLAESAKQSANQGNQHMSDLLKAMEEINDKSMEVQKIVKAIDEIAFQTNLLALNAAVEAARAGVHGKGFAVVAEEVRNLAQRSAKAAKETTDLIEGNVAAVDNGSNISNQTAKALQEILEGSTKVTDLVNEIASASKEQTEAVDQVSEALGQIDQVTQSNTASAEESAAAAEELSGQAENLQQMISRFKLRSQFKATAADSGRPVRMLGGDVALKTSEDRRSKPDVTEKSTSGTNGKEVAPDEVIRLDDEDFGEF